jgi:hypothetical protein
VNARIALLTLLVLSLTVAACGSTAPTAPPASPQGTAGTVRGAASATPGSSAPSAPSSPAPAASGAAPSAVGTAGPTGAADLTALLPSDVGGHKMQKAQYSGSEFANSGGISKPLADLLASLGRTAADLTLATANDPTRAVDVSIAAFKVRDVPVATFVAKYVPAVEAAFGSGSVTQGTRAGRPVYIVAGAAGQPPQVMLASTAALFVVSGTSDALVDEALAALP